MQFNKTGGVLRVLECTSQAFLTSGCCAARCQVSIRCAVIVCTQEFFDHKLLRSHIGLRLARVDCSGPKCQRRPTMLFGPKLPMEHGPGVGSHLKWFVCEHAAAGQTRNYFVLFAMACGEFKGTETAVMLLAETSLVCLCHQCPAPQLRRPT